MNKAGENFICEEKPVVTIMVQIMLPRFPPRKARNSPRLINFVVSKLKEFQPVTINRSPISNFSEESIWKLLTLTSLQKSSISRTARNLRELTSSIPSGETTLRWLKTNSIGNLNSSQSKKFLHFLKRLPVAFQKARKKGMILVLDFHTDPNYSKHKSNCIWKGKPKASTNRFYRFASLLWVNAPEPITLGVICVPQKTSITAVARALLNPVVSSEKVVCVLGDGEFYKWDLVSWLDSNLIPFIIRAHVRSKIKSLILENSSSLHRVNTGIKLDYIMKKRNTKRPCPVKLTLWRETTETIAFITLCESNWTAEEIRALYRLRFCIETYYRMMHRFQAFSCSRHDVVRFILVLIAFWLCNLWCYFKAPLNFLHPSSRRLEADKRYTASTFCEFTIHSGHIWLTRGRKVYSGRG